MFCGILTVPVFPQAKKTYFFGPQDILFSESPNQYVCILLYTNCIDHLYYDIIGAKWVLKAIVYTQTTRNM